jgi:hypothetical protein
MAACGLGDLLSCAGLACNLIPILSSCDPNEIQGPRRIWRRAMGLRSGNAAALHHLLRERSRICYPQPLRKSSSGNPWMMSLILCSFRLGSFGFSNYVFAVPEDRISYATTVDLPDSLGIDLQVTAGLDVVQDELFWVFQSINPITGLPPEDPEAGFLPVNDTLTKVGEGFAQYYIKAKTHTPTGNLIHAMAEITFDVNPPLETEEIFNTVDSGEPESEIVSATLLGDGQTIELSMLGEDDPGGVGLAGYDIWFSKDGSSYIPLVEGLEEDSHSFTAEPGSYYAFYSVARDHVNNEEEAPDLPDVTLNLAGGVPVCDISTSFIVNGGSIEKDTLHVFDYVEIQNYILEEGDTLTVSSGNFISFLPGFEAKGNLYAYTDSCKTVPEIREEELETEVERMVTGMRCYPNPFHNTASIEYQLDEESPVLLYVVDITGKQIALLDDGSVPRVGLQRHTFGNDQLQAGIYFVVLRTKDKQFTERLILIE